MFSPNNIEQFMKDYQYIKSEVHRRKIPPREFVLNVKKGNIQDPLYAKVAEFIVALDEDVNDDKLIYDNFDVLFKYIYLEMDLEELKKNIKK